MLTTLILKDAEDDAPDGGVVKPPPIGQREKPQKPDPRQVAAGKAGDKARDLKQRAREASYNALELDNSRKSHALAAEAHRAAAEANGDAKDQAQDPAAKQEFRNNEHEHNLHAAYHEKMSHSSEEDRKASAALRTPADKPHLHGKVKGR
jgi:hypothetical protein